MAALGSDARHLQAGRSPTGDEHASTCRRRLEAVATPLDLAARRRVDEARDPVVARPAPPTQLVARDARPHLLRPAAARLGHEVRVGDLAAHDGHHVGVPGGEHGLRRCRRADVALRLDHGVRHDLLQGGGERLAEALREQRRRHQVGEVEVAAGPARDVVHQRPLVVPGDDLLQLGDRQRPLRLGVEVDGEADDELVAAVPAHTVEQRCGEAHAVLERPAPPVGATVRPRRPELIDQGVVGGEQLDAVEPGALSPHRSARERADQLVDLRLGDGVAAVGIVQRRQTGRRPVRSERVVRIAVLTDVVQLLDHHDTAVGGTITAIGGLVAGVGEPAEVVDHAVVVGTEVPRVSTAVRCTGTGSTTIIPAPPMLRSR